MCLNNVGKKLVAKQDVICYKRIKSAHILVA